MKLLTSTKSLNSIVADLIILGVFENEKTLEPKTKLLDQGLEGRISELMEAGDFKGKHKQCCTIFVGKKNSTPRLLLMGLGKKSEYTLNRLREALSAASSELRNYRAERVVFVATRNLPPKTNIQKVAQTVIETLLLSTYDFTEYKKPSENEKVFKLSSLEFVLNKKGDQNRARQGLNEGCTIAEAVGFTRDLANQPGNIMTPQKLATAAGGLAEKLGLRCRVLEKTEMKKLGMGALLGVNQGSDLPPKFIVLEYPGKRSKPPVVLVGKGITFDSGGISIKTGSKMHEMKFDMAGAATVLGVIKAAKQMKLPVWLVGLIPATENLPSGSAIKPGDVVRALSGKTIEVINTDAEGRMILADALVYASRYKPKLVIDYATLTEAVVVALGYEISGVFSNRQNFIKVLQQAADSSGEKIWPLPLEESYKENLKSIIADIKNIGTSGRMAEAINAALFLKEFVDYPWVHLDIAGTAWTTKGQPWRPKGATGVGVRLTIEFLKNLD